MKDVAAAAPPRGGMIAIGLLAGCLSGLLGIGGGLVVGPILLLRGLPLRLATGTALAMVPGVALIGVLTELRLGTFPMPWLLVAAIALGGPIGLALGRRIMRRMPEGILWSCFLLLLALTIVRLLVAADGEPTVARWSPVEQPWSLALGVFAGVLAGCAAILFGVGGGVIVVPLLAFSLPEVGFSEASAVSLAAMVPTTALGLIGVLRDDRLARPWLWPLLYGGAPGAILGVYLRGHLLPPRVLELLFAAFLLVVLLRLVRSRLAAGSGSSA